MRGRVELQIVLLQVLIDEHDGRLVAASVTVVRGREDRDNLASMVSGVACLLQLMCSRNILEFVMMQELFSRSLAPEVAAASRGEAPVLSLLFGVRPHQVA